MQCVVISVMSWHRSSTVIILYKRSSSGDCFKFMKIILILFKKLVLIIFCSGYFSRLRYNSSLVDVI